MLIVGNCLVSEDIKNEGFSCDLTKCKGCCCVEGDAGAPLEKKEIEIIENLLPKIEPYMEEKAVEIVKKEGFWLKDDDGDLCTNIIDNKECVFVKFQDRLALCAIEMAYRNGDIDFIKPISCHLYPIRVKDYGEFRALNYHRWEICKDAVCKKGENPLYKTLKEPLIRRFSEKWYEELEQAIEQGQDY